MAGTEDHANLQITYIYSNYFTDTLFINASPFNEVSLELVGCAIIWLSLTETVNRLSTIAAAVLEELQTR